MEILKAVTKAGDRVYNSGNCHAAYFKICIPCEQMVSTDLVIDRNQLLFGYLRPENSSAFNQTVWTETTISLFMCDIIEDKMFESKSN